jgi:hypothetical protein
VSRRQRWIALGLYLLTSFLFFGVRLGPHFSRSYLGAAADRADPHAFFWFLNWWPYALSHGMNPMATHLVWSPTGFDVATATSVPLAAVAAWPITALFGPVVSFNVLMLLAPAMAAWTAFLLCRKITGAFLPSLVGGYLFGFSSYELAHLTAHPNLSMVFLIPLLVLLVVKHLRGELRPVAFTVLFALALTGQFLLSTELFATTTFFGAIALLTWLWLTRREWRGKEGEGRRVLGPILVAYAATAVVVAPFLIAYASHEPFTLVEDPTVSAYEVDLLNLVVPTPVTAVGGGWLTTLSAKFVGGLAENGSYVGIPLLAIAVLFAREQWRTTRGRLLTVMLIVVAVASLGSVLMVDHARTIPLPWTLFRHVPVLQLALPVRFAVFLFLVLAVVVATWLASPGRWPRTWVRWTLALVGLALLFPNLASSSWHGTVTTPAFFADGSYREFIPQGGNVLVIPAGRPGADSLRWQIETDEAFRLTAGYLSIYNPPEFDCWPILRRLRYDGPNVNSTRALRQFLASKRVDTIVLYGPRGELWRPVVEQLGMDPVDVGSGVVVADVPDALTFGRTVGTCPATP